MPKKSRRLEYQYQQMRVILERQNENNKTFSFPGRRGEEGRGKCSGDGGKKGRILSASRPLVRIKEVTQIKHDLSSINLIFISESEPRADLRENNWQRGGAVATIKSRRICKKNR